MEKNKELQEHIRKWLVELQAMNNRLSYSFIEYYKKNKINL